jgi:hypothetical protein
MKRTYYTKAEDGTFCAVELNETFVMDILGEYAMGEIRSALDAKVDSILSGSDLNARVAEAIDAVDIEDMARDMVHEEIQDRLSNVDISVDVSI